MSTLEVKALALQLGSTVDRLEKRIDHATRQSLQATQALDQQSKQSLKANSSLTRQVLEQIRQGSESAIAEGFRDAMRELDHTMREGTHRMEHAIAQLKCTCKSSRGRTSRTRGRPLSPALLAPSPWSRWQSMSHGNPIRISSVPNGFNRSIPLSTPDNWLPVRKVGFVCRWTTNGCV